MRPGADGAPASRPPAWLTEEAADRAVLRLKVVPRAARTAIAGVCGDALRIRLSAPPADGKANAALVGFLSENHCHGTGVFPVLPHRFARDRIEERFNGRLAPGRRCSADA